jgi:hypothetical protein
MIGGGIAMFQHQVKDAEGSITATAISKEKS